MFVDVLEAKDIVFTLVTNKNCKEKNKASFLPFMSFSGSKNKILLISWACPLFKAVTTCLASKLVSTHSGLAMTSSLAVMISILCFAGVYLIFTITRICVNV